MDDPFDHPVNNNFIYKVIALFVTKSLTPSDAVASIMDDPIGYASYNNFIDKFSVLLSINLHPSPSNFINKVTTVLFVTKSLTTSPSKAVNYG